MAADQHGFQLTHTFTVFFNVLFFVLVIINVGDQVEETVDSGSFLSGSLLSASPLESLWLVSHLTSLHTPSHPFVFILFFIFLVLVLILFFLILILLVFISPPVLLVLARLWALYPLFGIIGIMFLVCICFSDIEVFSI